MRIDLNCDVGESYYAKKIGQDEALIPLITSCNIACGFHGGDPLTIQNAIVLAIKNGVQIGAHPSYPDLENFGRKKMDLSSVELKASLRYQIGVIQKLTEFHGGKMSHVKPHGALYNEAAKDFNLAVEIAEVIKSFGQNLIFLGQANSQMEKAAALVGIPFVKEVFADRTYTNNGLLVPRTKKGAVISSVKASSKQALQMLLENKVSTIEGELLHIEAESICVHGDSENALVFVNKLRKDFLNKNIQIKSF
ncbi:5-oxoprolinase subunit PxpA [Flavicella sediminum]|uniref:5-oxoprolinase subunit PxpA n=1 Tax=Flavicella sediminum TaxID=2585141 RepID=UPI00111D308C|nr:5-oxoprolinase subunit PxpA [Flavicella sediminum]